MLYYTVDAIVTIQSVQQKIVELNRIIASEYPVPGLNWVYYFKHQTVASKFSIIFFLREESSKIIGFPWQLLQKQSPDLCTDLM